MSWKLRREVAELEAIVRSTEGATGKDSRQSRGLASYRLGNILFDAGRYAESLEHSARAAKVLAELPPLHTLSLHALATQGGALFLLERYEECVAVCDQVIALRNAEPEILNQLEQGLGGIAGRRRDYIADAWWYEAAALDRLGRVDEADASATGLIEEFDPGETPPQRYVVAQTFLRRGRLARARGDLDGALAALKEARARCAPPESQKFMHTDCMALFEQASVLQQAGLSDKAIADYRQLVTQFGSVKDPDVREAVADARRLQSKLVGQRLDPATRCR